jgi:hypothetical protein
MPELSQIVKGRIFVAPRHLNFWILTMGAGWNIEIVFN